MSKAFIYGIGGGTGSNKAEETKAVELSMQRGDQVIIPTIEKVLTKVTVTKPSSMMAENIKKGVNIGGVVGIYDVGGTALPTLNAVSITRVGVIFNIENTDNGNFVNYFKVYSNGNMAEEIRTKSFEIKNLDVGNHNIIVRAVGDNFNESNNSNVLNCTVFSITSNLIGLTTSNIDERIADKQTYVTTIKAVKGKYLPEFITVKLGEESHEYTYNSYSGVLTISNVNDDIEVTAIAYDIPKLRAPIITLKDSNIKIDTVVYVKTYNLYIDNVIAKAYENEYVDFIEVRKVEGSKYGFDLNENSFYESTNKGIQGTFALCRIYFALAFSGSIKVQCVSLGEPYQDYGVLSNLDCPLSLSIAEDDQANIKKSFIGFYGSSINTVTYDITSGGHFIDVKYIKNSSVEAGNDSLQFKIEFIGE